MDCFNYPIDVKTLRRKKASIRRTLLEQPNLIEKKIARKYPKQKRIVDIQLMFSLLSIKLKLDNKQKIE